MSYIPLTLRLDPVTHSVLHAYAQSRHLPLDEAALTLLYRDAAAMTGWPGQTGADLQRAMLQAALGDDDAGDDEG